ncbi:MAG: DegT/DnrJ/EryC1/StrS family aminotransferase, partial [Candidatus Hodarchaeota archaeon]
KSQFILLVHYFGTSIKNFEYIIDFCKKHSILIIEDCAHCFGAKYKNRFLGTFGDFAIFSLKKFFPIISGGLLLVNKVDISIDDNLVSKKKIKYLLIVKKFLKTNFIIKLFPLKLKSRNNIEDLQSNNTLYEMDNLSRYIFHRQNFEKISEKRKQNFLYYLNEFKFLNINLIQKLDNNFSPWVFPVIVKENCKTLYQILLNNGISCEIWDFLPQIVFFNEKFSNVIKFSKNILLLPVHQNMTKRELKFVSSKIKGFCK